MRGTGGYKRGTLLEEYFLNPHFKPTKKEQKELDDFFKLIKKKLDKRSKTKYNNNLTNREV
tara:strand:- start:4 stop:186 length:183 start_codon:yes stop_codon:yes gene_type:complete